MHVSDTAAGVLEQGDRSVLIIRVILYCVQDKDSKKRGTMDLYFLTLFKNEAKMLQKWPLSADGRHLESVQIVR